MKVFRLFVLWLVPVFGFSQTTVTTQPLLSSDTYSRDPVKIDLQPNFHYKAQSVTTPSAGVSPFLLNLNISGYPSYVPNGYSVPFNAGCGLTPNNFNNSLVGETAGKFAVSPTGSAIYNIPIYVSPGTSNMAPSLNVAYNSDVKDGLLGVGWNLVGLSSISRVNKNPFLDGKFETIQLNIVDQFSLDGNRLMPKSGIYGTGGATYSTEKETFATIISNAGTNGPLSFDVTDKFGNKMQYGYTTDSRLSGIGDNTVLVWYLNKITDEYGNYVNYSYKTLNGETVIDKIEYTGNSAAGMLPYNTVTFEYMEKAEKNSFYVAGKEFRNTQLLKSITSKAEGQLARKYVFDYKFDRVTLLAKITEVASDGSELRPTTFCWSDPYSQSASNPNEASFQLFPSQSDFAGLRKAINGDFDGNGFADVLTVYQNQYRFKISTYDNTNATSPIIGFNQITPQGNTSLGLSSEILSTCITDADLDGRQEAYLILNSVNTPFAYIVQKVVYNGNSSGGSTSITESGFSFSSTVTPTYLIPHYFIDRADYTGDGVVDEITVDPERIKVNSAQGNLTDTYTGGNVLVRGIDLDGDGVKEFIFLDDQTTSLGIKVFKYVVGNPFLSLVHSSSISYSGNTNTKLHTLFGLGDFNGDGKTDICYLSLNLSDMNIIYSTGTSFTTPKKIDSFTPLSALPSGEHYNISAPDINSDGKNDLLITNNLDHTATSAIDNYFTYFSSGDIFIKGPSAKGLWTSFELNSTVLIQTSVLVPDYNLAKKRTGYHTEVITTETNFIPVFSHNFDLNGDGNYDAISLKDLSHQKIVFNSISSTNADYLYQIVTGLGKQINITYANTNTEFDKNQIIVYSNDNATSYSLPLSRIKPNKWVVSKVNYTSTFMATGINSSYGTGINDPQISNTYRYAYVNAIFHREGRGFLGFEKTLSFHENTMIGSQSVNSFNTAYFIPLNTENVSSKISQTTIAGILRYSANTAQKSSSTTINYVVTNSPPNSFFVAAQTVINKNYLNSVASKTDYNYDLSKAGNIVSMNTEYFWKAGDPITYSVNTTYNYQQEGLATNKIFKIKEIKERTAHKDAPGNTYERITQYNYDGSGHLIEISKDPLVSGNNVKTQFPTASFNAFGQPTHIELAGDAPTNRKTDVQYDSKGRFVTKTINTYGHTSETTYEPVYGNAIQTKDITGLVSTFKYDGLGRIVETTLPNGAINTQSYDYQIPAYGNNNRNGVYAVTTINEPEGPSTNYFDSYNRMLRNEKKGFNNTTIYTDMFYDTDGRLWQQSEPYLSTQTKFLVQKNKFTDPFFRLTETQAFHRDLSVITVTEPTATLTTSYIYSNASTDATYIPFNLFYQDQAGEGVRKFLNVAGQTTTVQTMNGGNALQNSVCTYTDNGQPKEIDLSYFGGNFTPDSKYMFEYDLLGRRSKMIDPSSGTTKYEYNALGEITKQTDGNNNIYTFAYDDLGRLASKNGSGEGATNYQYVTSGNGLEQIEKIIHANVTTDFKYDNLNRAIEYKETLPSSKIFKTNYTFDKYGRTTQYKYPSGFTINNTYDAQGYLTQIKNAGNNSLIWELDDLNALDQVKQFTYNNTLQTVNSFDAIHQTTLTANSVLTQSYTMYTPFGANNMKKRGILSGINDFQEEFAYDQQQQLNSFTELNPNNTPKTAPVQTQIDYKGNITKKDDAGDYVYGNPNKPFTLTGINNAVNTISLYNLNITYNDFNKVKQINEATTLKQMDFTYGTNGERLQVDYKINGISQYTRFYCSKYEREETSTSFKEWNYIFAPSGLAAVLYNNNGTETLYYIQTDHLGSPIQLTNSNNTGVVEEYSFDAWGRRRNPNNWSDYNVNPSNFILHRGFTFHEHIDEFNLINMNGRVYDPVLGRFIQPDILVQDPDNIRTYNSYAYATNNPLRYTDPSGHSYIGLFLGSYITTSIGEIMEGGWNPRNTYYETKTTFDDVSNLLSFTANYPGMSVTAGIDPYGFGAFVRVSAQRGNFDYGVTFGAGLENGAYAFGQLGYTVDDWHFSLGGGLFENGYAYGGSISYKGYGAEYYQTVYGNSANNPSKSPNPQKIGGVGIFGPNWSFRIENDFLSQTGDKWRTQAMELTVGKFSIGSSIYTNDPENLPGTREQRTDFAGTDSRGNTNRHGNGAWKDGFVYDTPVWIGYNYGPGVSRVGYSHPRVQDSQQNAIHLYFPPGYQNFYNQYSPSATGYYSYNSYYNPYSLYGR